MLHEYLVVDHSLPLSGTVPLEGAKNAILVIMASLILTSGKSRLTNVPASQDVYTMIALLTSLGAQVIFDAENNVLEVDTESLDGWQVSADIMKKIRASILVMGPLLARHGRASVALPGGDLIGTRPIDLHLKAFAKMGAIVDRVGEFLTAQVAGSLRPIRFVLDYPSVGATENILMAAVRAPGVTKIVNAALEPEVLDLIEVLRKMGAHINYEFPATICIEGVDVLKPVEHSIMYDRLEAGTLLLAAAITGGELNLPQAPIASMELFFEKLNDMGHSVTVKNEGVTFKATKSPKAISFKTMPYPGFPTDLQAPTLAAACLAEGTSIIHETVYENRMLHVRELQKMGAQIELHGETAKIKGVESLYGASVIASDIRAGAALVLAGLAARGTTTISGVHHIKRGYQGLDQKLTALGGKVRYVIENELEMPFADVKKIDAIAGA